MYQSHASYSRVGLGSERTDLLVRLVREATLSLILILSLSRTLTLALAPALAPALALQAGEGSGLFGAKITGGGSGGSVCVVGEAGAKAEASLPVSPCISLYLTVSPCKPKPNPQASLRRVLARYEQETGVSPYVFEGGWA